MFRHMSRLITNAAGKTSLFPQISSVSSQLVGCSKFISTQSIYCKSPSHIRTLTAPLSCTTLFSNPSSLVLLNKPVQTNVTSVRPLVKFSLTKGKRKSVKAVTKRFYRLHWGIWIRPIVGRAKKVWKKSDKMKIRAKQHVFCNATQSTLLDKMVSSFWRRPRYYVDDLYTPYHTRQTFPQTRK